MRSLYLALLLLIAVMAGCTKDDGAEVDFTTWDEAKVYAFLNEVDAHVKPILLETDSRDKIIGEYEKYFSRELSEKIFDSLYVKDDKGWHVPPGDAGYIFMVPGKSGEGSQTKMEFAKDYIKVRETYDLGLYLAVEYTIRYQGKPVITDWTRE